MITEYKYSREQIIDFIFSSPKTRDGNYFINKVLIKKMLQRNGQQDDDCYYYDRKLFENNMYFSIFDISLFRSTYDMGIIEENYYIEQTRFSTLNAEMYGKSLNYKFKERDFTVEELIDCNEFFSWRKSYFK